MPDANGNVVWVTSAFLGAREDRPWLYYLHPLADQARSLAEAGAAWHVWTWDRSVRAVRTVVDDRNVRVAEPEAISRELWERQRWEGRLASLHVQPDSIDVRSPWLLDVWLAKLPLVIESLRETGAEIGLWSDCSQWISVDCDHRYDAYAGSPTPSFDLARGLPAILQAVRQRGILLCGELPAERPLSLDLALQRRWCYGAYFALRADYAGEALATARRWWSTMLDAGRIASDEPVLALAADERDWPMWTYPQWQEVIQSGMRSLATP